MKFIQAAVLTAAVSALSVIPANGQIQFGVAAGLNWSGLGDVDLGSITAAYESQQGWHAGVFLDLKLLVIGIRPGFYYVNAGPLLEGGLSGEETTPIDELTAFDLTYVSIPVDLKLGLPLVLLEPYLFVGPEFKFNTVSESAGEVAEQLESTVIAGNAGFGVAVNVGGIKLIPELRVGFDISSLFGDTITIEGVEFKVDSHRASSFVARLGVGF